MIWAFVIGIGLGVVLVGGFRLTRMLIRHIQERIAWQQTFDGRYPRRGDTDRGFLAGVRAGEFDQETSEPT